MNDAISRSEVLRMIERTKDAAMSGEAVTFTKSQKNAIRAIADLFYACVKDVTALDIAPVVHDDSCSLICTDKLDEWKSRIVVSENDTKNCAVYYADSDRPEQVVRCKDCIHAVDITNYRMAKRFGDHARQCMRCRGDSGFGYLDLSVVYQDGFCDEGERRDGEADE